MGCYSISLQVKCWEGMYVAFHLDSWAEVGILQLILEFGETQIGSGMINGNQLYICWRFVLKELVSSVGQVEIMYRFHWDRVSISFGALKPRLCVDFAEIACRFRQVFIGFRLRFEKSSPRWRIIGKERRWKLDEACGIQLGFRLHFWKGVGSN